MRGGVAPLRRAPDHWCGGGVPTGERRSAYAPEYRRQMVCAPPWCGRVARPDEHPVYPSPAEAGGPPRGGNESRPKGRRRRGGRPAVMPVTSAAHSGIAWASEAMCNHDPDRPPPADGRQKSKAAMWKISRRLFGRGPARRAAAIVLPVLAVLANAGFGPARAESGAPRRNRSRCRNLRRGLRRLRPRGRPGSSTSMGSRTRAVPDGQSITTIPGSSAALWSEEGRDRRA